MEKVKKVKKEQLESLRKKTSDEIQEKIRTALDRLLKARTPKDDELLGKFIHYHLIIERYLLRYLEAKLPGVDWSKFDGIRYFSQKVKLISVMDQKIPDNYMQGLIIVNKIRNKFAHDLAHTIIDANLVEQLSVTLDKGDRAKHLANMHRASQVGGVHLAYLFALELFTARICSYIGGLVAGMAARKDYTQFRALENILVDLSDKKLRSPIESMQM